MTLGLPASRAAPSTATSSRASTAPQRCAGTAGTFDAAVAVPLMLVLLAPLPVLLALLAAACVVTTAAVPAVLCKQSRPGVALLFLVLYSPNNQQLPSLCHLPCRQRRWCWATHTPWPSMCGAWAAWQQNSSWGCPSSQGPASTTCWAASSGGGLGAEGLVTGWLKGLWG